MSEISMMEKINIIERYVDWTKVEIPRLQKESDNAQQVVRDAAKFLAENGHAEMAYSILARI